MGLQSLRDKLLQAGLVSQDEAQKAEHPSPAAAPKPKAGPARDRSRPQAQAKPRTNTKAAGPRRELTPEEKLAREEEAAFREREHLLNKEREENRKRAAEDRRRLEGVRAIAEKHEIAERGEEAFHFTTRKRKLQRIYLTSEQLSRLELGDLAIMDKPLPSELSFSLVPREAAEQALALDPKALRFYNRGFGQTFGFKAEPAPGEKPVAADDSEEPAVPEA